MTDKQKDPLDSLGCLFFLWANLFFLFYAVQTIWNWFAPSFGVMTISYAQAIGLTFLARCLRGFRYNEPVAEHGLAHHLATTATIAFVLAFSLIASKFI